LFVCEKHFYGIASKASYAKQMISELTALFNSFILYRRFLFLRIKLTSFLTGILEGSLSRFLTCIKVLVRSRLREK
jgi:hypothetical protein